MNLAVVVGIVLIGFMAVIIIAWDDEEIAGEALMAATVVAFLVAEAVVLCTYYESKPEDYTQDCVCSCECCGRSETE